MKAVILDCHILLKERNSGNKSMGEFLKYLIEAIMDAIEEFFRALNAPSTTFTFYAFLVSLGFIAWSVAAELFYLPSFVGWQEAVTNSVLLLVIVMIDTSARGKIKKSLKKVKSVASKFTYNGEQEQKTDVDGTEVYENGQE